MRFIVIMLAMLTIGTAVQAGDALKGEKVFKKCKMGKNLNNQSHLLYTETQTFKDYKKREKMVLYLFQGTKKLGITRMKVNSKS